MAREQHREAGADLRAALRLEPGSARWEVGLGRVLVKAERLEAKAQKSADRKAEKEQIEGESEGQDRPV